MSVEAIKKALEGVTPGPWEVYSEKVADKAAAIAESAYQVEHTEPFVGEVYMLNAGGKCPALTGCGPCSGANARYIAAVNPAAISELLSTLESGQAEENRLRTIALDMQAGYREAIARAETTEKALNSLCAWMLHRFGPNTPEGREASCRMSSRTTLASTGGDHHGN